MAKTNKARKAAGNQDVSSGIHRAAARAGIETPEKLEPIPPGSIAELDLLRDIAARAEQIFEHHGEMGSSPIKVLREALRSAGDDFAMLGISEWEGGGVPTMIYRRAELRTQLALALFEYRSEYGYVESDYERKARKAVEAEQAEGGAS